MLLPDYPGSYVVQEDDTLWTIAGRFLHEPERWPEIWQPDPYLDNADQIYPGDILSINFVGGSPRVMVKRGDRIVEARGPQVRSEPLSSSIPAIPLETIESSFTRNRIVSQELYDAAPYIVQNLGDNLAIGTGDEVYARGDWPAATTLFEIYRPSREYFDEEDNDVLLGLEVEYLGFASIRSTAGPDLRRLTINNSSKEIRVGDRLLVREVQRIGATIFPTPPDTAVEGHIIALLNHEAMASQLDTVVVNLGLEDALKVGDVLAVREEDSAIVDEVERSRMGFRERMRAIFSGERLSLPGDEVGTLLVYRVFDEFSYALILSSLRPIELQNRVTDP
ncbi:MAG: LysM domain-containing protein [Pseudohongiellaceae bacterium]